MADRVHYAIYDGAAERLAAWRSSTIPAVRDAAYAAVLRRQFAADGTARVPEPGVVDIDLDPDGPL